MRLEIECTAICVQKLLIIVIIFRFVLDSVLTLVHQTTLRLQGIVEKIF